MSRSKNATQNERFLNAIDSQAKDLILAAIADHYGITPERAYAEVIAPEAEHFLDYMVEPHRSAAYALMQARGFA